MLRNTLIPLYLYLGQPVPRPTRLYDYLIAAQGIVKRLVRRVTARRIDATGICE